MPTRMLIDARHSEETRVAVLKGHRIEEFDFDSADHKQIKGNIYLAKVTRVEPSLQAAFVDFGGNRHGFLAFSEIHPDYYQIPREDREALLAEEAAHAEEEAALRASEDGDEDYDDDARDDDDGVVEVDTSEKDSVATIEAGQIEDGFEGDHDAEESAEEGEANEGGRRPRRGRRQGRQDGQSGGRAKEAEELRAKRMALRRRYKIQDVIQRRQVLLVQVVKEERGNKGAALTTYLSLAGRYCVLMPNSSHGGGISRKISSVADRKRLKSIIAEMDLPKSMGCIVRTAGLQRTKVEIKRDFDYLARLWDEIRENTLNSAAPALIHSDSDLIKRAIRDIYNREIEEVIVEGDDGYRAARDFMKLLMPSHARRVKHYADPVPLFQRFGAEDQLSAMYDPVVQLKSGGYIVINPTEALVSIDINSGRSTKEHGIEQTAVATNLEAAREIARQLRLRDMAGLVVIDFIDMEYGSNVRKVEKAMKDALKDDRARIQVGRISSFGLMEMSRQRLRTGVLEATTRGCPHCDGTGLVRTAGSSGLSALRLIEEEAAKGKGIIITLFASQEAAIYVLNTKRADLAEIEARYGVAVEVIPEGENEGAKMRVISSGPRNEFVPKFEPLIIEEDLDDLPEEEDEDDIEEGRAPRDGGREPREPREPRKPEDGEGEGDGSGRRKRRKRRRGRGRDRREDGTTIEVGDADYVEEETSEEGETSEAEGTEESAESGDSSDDNSDEAQRKRRRRKRRRGGRGRGADGQASDIGENEAGESEAGENEVAESDTGEAQPEPVAEVAPEAPEAKPKRTRRKKAEAVSEEASVSAEQPAGETAEPAPEKPKRAPRRAKAAEAAAAPEAPAETPVEAQAEATPKPKRAPRKKKAEAEAPAEPQAEPAVEAVPAPQAEQTDDAPQVPEDTGPPRRGWWQRTFGE